ncbi:hypothetical protein [Nesterenkonia sp. K-15-9-6]|uniref:hypothetical protein n=1 Tax=Nesterenkonia sp. K-15-9-6 TaxID=3093918 RepID=UPI00404435BF
MVDDTAAKQHRRFWSKVVKGPGPACWIWTGALSDDGYGRFYLHEGPGGMVRPHRYSYAITEGIDLTDIDQLMHTCDVPICVNPDHLAAGDRIDNMVDRRLKGRDGNGSAARFRGVPKAVMAERSRKLRDEVRVHGWVPERVASILAVGDPDAPTLF